MGAITPLTLPELFYEEGSFGVFLLVTIALGGGASWLTGRAIAATWRPWWQVGAYMLVLGAVVRFFHFSLFGGTLLSAHYYAVDTLVCLAIGYVGFRLTRVRQMVQQYHWLNVPAGRLRWRRRGP